MPILASCTSCGKQYRVADDAAGRTFRCSTCKATFTVPSGSESGSRRGETAEEPYFPPARRQRRNDSENEDYERERRGRRRKRRRSSSSDVGFKTTLPAIFLYIVGGISMMFWLFTFTNALIDPEALKHDPDNPFAFHQPAEKEPPVALALAMILGIALLQGVILGGAFCMQTQRVYGMALTGCVLAAIPCISPCCVLGIPFGIWGFIVLLMEDVRSAFR
jgi:predicted Zn finger-like uncharacterized protein